MTRRMRPAVLSNETCAWCGTNFIANRAHGPRPLESYCSQACRHLLTSRRAGRWTPETRSCGWCGATYVARHPAATSCSPKCGYRLRDKRRKTGRVPRVIGCVDCGVAIPPTTAPYGKCAECRAVALRALNRRKNTKRRGTPVGDYTREQIGDRDGWRCHLCRQTIDRRLSGLHPRGPTIDHLIPLAAGGTDDPLNVALAHRRCNIQRGTGGIVQLRLVA